MTNDITETLKDREKTYGNFSNHADITQALKNVMQSTSNWQKLTNDKKESLDMIANKIGRILNGDPDFHDSWHDIVGYAKLVADKLNTPTKDHVCSGRTNGYGGFTCTVCHLTFCKHNICPVTECEQCMSYKYENLMRIRGDHAEY